MGRAVGHRYPLLLIVATIISLFAQSLNSLDLSSQKRSGGPRRGNHYEPGYSRGCSRPRRHQRHRCRVIVSITDPNTNAKSLRIQVLRRTLEVQQKVKSDLAISGRTNPKVGVNDISSNFCHVVLGPEITKKAVRALIVFIILVAAHRLALRVAGYALAISDIHDVPNRRAPDSILQVLEVTPATVIAFTIFGLRL